MKKARNVVLLTSIWNFTEAAILMVAGICFMIFCQNVELQKVIFIIVGAFLIADGILRILTDFIPLFKAKKASDLTYKMAVPGSLELAFGITLCCSFENLTAFTSFISLFIGICLIVAGAFLLTFAIAFLARRLFKIYMPVLEIILALVLLTLGSVILVYMRDLTNFMAVVLIITGVMCVVVGISLIAITVIKLKGLKVVDNTIQAVKQTVEEAVEEPIETFDMTNKKEEDSPKKDDETPVSSDVVTKE